MSLPPLDDLADEVTFGAGRCELRKAIDAHERGADIDEWITARTRSAPIVAKTLITLGIKTSATTIRNHRSGECGTCLNRYDR